MTAEPEYWDDTEDTEDFHDGDTADERLARDRDRASMPAAESGPRYRPWWVVVGGTALFVLAVEVEPLMDIAAWVLAVLMFVVIVILLAVFIRWLFKVPGT
jgi:hypothetical protein